jgi:hypothetical protein
MWSRGWQFDVQTWLPAFRECYERDMAIPGNHDYLRLSHTDHPQTV